MRRLKLAVIGVGKLGSVHARILSKLKGARLMGVADPDQAARDSVAEQCRTSAFADYHALLELIDAAVIATPTAHHCEVGVELLERGIHLLVEKPLAATSRDADRLIAAARKGGAVLQVGHVERFNPGLEAALPHLGEAKFIQATRATPFSGRSLDVGAVMDLMIHDIDVAMSLARSRVTGVEAFGVSLFGGHEDLANARLTFANGCVANLNASRASFELNRTMSVWSDASYAHIDFGARRARVAHPSEALLEGEVDVLAFSAEELAEFRERLATDYLVQSDLTPEPRDQLTAELEDFVEAVRQGRSPRVTGEQGRDAVAVAEAVLHGIATHRWDGHSEGRVGPHVRGGHVQALPLDQEETAAWDLTPATIPMRREAG